jgi:7-keto-8-aminopelargonate synthetase-like enzyme
VVNFVMHNSRPYIFSASMPPANCAAALTALRIIKREPERVQRLSDLSAYARKGFIKRGIKIIESDTPIIPVYTYELENTFQKAKELYDEGVYVNPVIPPATQPGNCLLRTSYMATLTEELIDEALDIFDKVLKR